MIPVRTSVGELGSRLAILLGQQRHWIFLGLALLVVASILSDLATGSVRLRGVGTYQRSDQPATYWRATALKAFVGLVCGYLSFKFWS